MAANLLLLIQSTVFDVLNGYAKQVGISKPQIIATEGSKNGNSFSGHVYRVLVLPEGADAALNNVEPNKEESDPEPEPDDYLRDPHDDQLAANSVDSLHLIAKIPPKVLQRRKMYRSGQHFTREKYVYEKVLPAFEQFQAEKLDAADIFRHYPRMLSASSVNLNEYVLLNDLQHSGFRNEERTLPLSFDKCLLALTQLAHFHAVSFAFKDQQPEQFAELTKELGEIMFKDLPEAMVKFMATNIEYAISSMEEETDAETMARVKSFGEQYGESMIAACSEREDAIVLHGDCWISNLMFRRKVSLMVCCTSSLNFV